MREVICILALLLIASTGSADLIDLDKYILSTGDYRVNVDLALPATNETTGEYVAMAVYSQGSQVTTIMIMENVTKLDEANLTADGYKAVKKPYPGWMLTNSTSDEVTYIGTFKPGSIITAMFDGYQAAINQLPDLKVISREEYQAIKAAELQEALN